MNPVEQARGAHQQLLELLQRAGEVILRHRRPDQAVHSKQPGEIVTAADVAAQQLLVEGLRQLGSLPIYSEEGSEYRSQAATRWIVDPLDGTTPWVWGNSGFSVSLALEHQGQVLWGAVHDPVMQETFHARRGAGAWRDEEALRACTHTELEQALLVADWGNADAPRRQGLDYLERLLWPRMQARRVVPQFAPALGLCRIAEGRIHGLVCNDTWVEDHAAGQLILEEAGGASSNFDGSPFQLRVPGIVAAAHPGLHRQLLEAIG